MKKNKISTYFIFISCLTLFAVFIIIVQSSYNRLVLPSQSVQLDPLLNSIDPNINNQTLINIKNRYEFSSDELNQLFTPTPVSTDSGSSDILD